MEEYIELSLWLFFCAMYHKSKWKMCQDLLPFEFEHKRICKKANPVSELFYFYLLRSNNSICKH